ncbi:class III lanthipeptide [Peptoniphilus vaginalis]
MSAKILKLQEMKANESKVVSRKSSQSNSCNTRSSISILCK